MYIFPPGPFPAFFYAFPTSSPPFPLSPPGTSFVAFAWRFLIALVSNHEHSLLCGFWTKYREEERGGQRSLLTEITSGPAVLTKGFLPPCICICWNVVLLIPVFIQGYTYFIMLHWTCYKFTNINKVMINRKKKNHWTLVCVSRPSNLAMTKDAYMHGTVVWSNWEWRARDVWCIE